jgi:hypothetical protein
MVLRFVRSILLQSLLRKGLHQLDVELSALAQIFKIKDKESVHSKLYAGLVAWPTGYILLIITQFESTIMLIGN